MVVALPGLCVAVVVGAAAAVAAASVAAPAPAAASEAGELDAVLLLALIARVDVVVHGDG